MSRKYVREKSREWIVKDSPIPYYDTINLKEDPDDEFWCTLEFNHEFTEVDTFCRSRKESGVIDIIVSGQPGTGDGDDQFMKSSNPTSSSGYIKLSEDIAHRLPN